MIRNCLDMEPNIRLLCHALGPASINKQAHFRLSFLTPQAVGPESHTKITSLPIRHECCYISFTFTSTSKVSRISKALNLATNVIDSSSQARMNATARLVPLSSRNASHHRPQNSKSRMSCSEFLVFTLRCLDIF